MARRMIPLFYFLVSVVGLINVALASNDGVGKGVVGYDSYKVYRFYKNNGTGDLIKDMVLPLTDDFNVWTHNKNFIDIMIAKEINLENAKGIENYNYEVMIEDVYTAISETVPKKNENRNNNDINHQQESFDVGKINMDNFFFKEYRDLETIYVWLDLLKRSFPDLVNIETVGETFEGREMKAVHVSANNRTMNPNKKTVVITGGVHAREWVSISTACWVLYQLLARYGVYRKDTKYLNALDFLIIPVFNPDGYKYSWTTDRLWRKNRQNTYWPNCYGVDIDHSFDYNWVSNDNFPCSEDYSGEKPFEALEASSWNNYLNTTKGEYQIYGYIDLHSYSQEILYPYAYSCEAVPRDLENLIELSYGLGKAMRNKNGKKYQVLSACQDRGSDLTPGLGAGSALDYMYHHRAHWAFQLKLRDTGRHGFLLPSDQITPVGKETYAAIRYFCDFVLNPDL
ncbi:hypothetical protein TPHA_0F02040 [Tetrapisispora phaffii CBS 4417]|uniref:Inactive metallocarboxypeptidase ECM14 n=1 Tax=Tetrapisispora phaffii (strain ATCC 24235 / CBS 4417 / NBRC 1672 / NRRL Y-8282 / UCD 70-5) TaxID=1071381 RepID=G8BVA4_TETPH|nr:hypothetical protein TPHA_0F02040 [Tetrapisispora phaffii CBS 4417]CCE63686.1 hypothetical protein TPHA_0F02040 [Tetrapisispora phaffii CBS 4417]